LVVGNAGTAGTQSTPINFGTPAAGAAGRIIVTVA
jgi:hypothetical protein